MKSRYRPPPQDSMLTDIDDSIFLFEKLGKCVIKHKKKYKESDRDDIIIYNAEKDSQELEDNFKIGSTTTPSLTKQIKSIVTKYWDSFCSAGARRPIIGYEFSINTGNHTPVCKYNSDSSDSHL